MSLFAQHVPGSLMALGPRGIMPPHESLNKDWLICRSCFFIVSHCCKYRLVISHVISSARSFRRRIHRCCCCCCCCSCRCYREPTRVAKERNSDGVGMKFGDKNTLVYHHSTVSSA